MYKEMSEHMTDTEVSRCMSILIESSYVTGIERDYQQNVIYVSFRMYGDRSQHTYQITLLPDSIADIPDGITFRTDGKYLYQQYTIAKGYSEFWRGNFFIDT